jgi:DNA-binding winged helix-turn-helix (wHTH) protein/WD40 repeat protein
MSFWFGDFELDQERRQLLRSGEPVPLEPKAYELLSLLLERRPRALSRAQIRDVIWPETYVSESTLAVVVNAIRHALGDDARAPRFIRTVHGFGYAFCGEARASGDDRPVTGEPVREPSPYPGLSSFTEADAEHFFGREAEVEALWEKIRRRTLLAVIGPSGVGKTSFLRAGVIPSRPEGWGALRATPGARPALGLAQALTAELAGDAEAVSDLLGGVSEVAETGEGTRVVSAVRRWRSRHGEGLLVVDQLEELFTLSGKETPARFAALLGRIASEAGVHVVLSLRDDFLFRCSEHAPLAPVFESLTPLPGLTAEGLRRALVEPAARRGVRFEDDGLVEEMVEAVASERGALPLLAFAVSRLWAERDRERKLLTREAYERMGGAAGALANHAEATLAQLGEEREVLVREIFRNLVTAQGTRAAVDRAELLSVSGDRQEEAGAVLDALVDARLLTEYEPAGAEGSEAAANRRRIEIVHESLLTHWPRLVCWRTQDADGAQLRDQLRQTAHLWDERRRPDDLLWTGPSFLDYRAWRARYAGGLSALEEAFARAMTALANRRRRRRRLAVAAIVTALAVGLGIVGVLWTRSEAARRQADAEVLRAEARGLVALGQAERERNPTAALAYATKSLELVDSEDARLLALRVLQGGPTALRAPANEKEPPFRVAFSPGGEWLAAGGNLGVRVRHRNGEPSIVVRRGYAPTYAFGPEDHLLVADHSGEIGIWSLPEGREVRRLKVEEGGCWLFVRGRRLFTATGVGERVVVRWAPLVEGDLHLVGTIAAAGLINVDAAGTQITYVPGPFHSPSGREVYVRSLVNWAMPPRLVAVHPAAIQDVAFHPDGRQVAVADTAGRIRIWATDGGSERLLRILDCAGAYRLAYSPRGRWLAAAAAGETSWYATLWDLKAPPSTEPLRFPIAGLLWAGWDVDPSEHWLAAARSGSPAGIDLWPLGEMYPRSVGRHDWYVDDVLFTPDGSTLVSAAGTGSIYAWSMSLDGPGPGRILLRETLNRPRMAVDANGRRVAVSTYGGPVVVLRLAGGEVRRFEGFAGSVAGRVCVAFSPDGRRLAAAPAWGPAEEKVIRVWDVESGACRALGPLPGAGEGDAGAVSDLSFLDDDHIVAGSPTSGVLSFDLRGGGHKVLSSRPARALVVGQRKRIALAALGEPDEIVRLGLDGREATRVFSCPGCMSLALDPTDAIVAAGSTQGVVRIGPASGGEPHLFFSQTVSPQRVAFSPDSRWVASSGERTSVWLWPVPDVTRTPLHKRSHDELLATLRSWSNLRAVKDPQSPTGWTLDPGPFPGWEKLPHW